MRAQVDLRFRGVDRVICTYLRDGDLIDPGPASTYPLLREVLRQNPPERVLLTHIHLDHSGSAGLIATEFPDVEIVVHERGARHLVNPERLLASAARIYGDAMDELWGEVRSVPARQVRAVKGGERLGAVDVLYTPGHAKHHVTYLYREDGAAFVGDVAGVRIPDSELVVPPTPPPDIDVVAWRRSLDAIARLDPASLHLAHFGSVEDAQGHLRATARALTALEAKVADGERACLARYEESLAIGGAGNASRYRLAAPPEHQFAGMASWLEASRDVAGGGGAR